MTTKWQDTRAGKRFLAAHGHKKRVRMTWLARCRILWGMTVKEASVESGLSPRSWEAWERVGRAHREPHVLALRALVARFGAFPVAGGPYVTVNPATLEVIS